MVSARGSGEADRLYLFYTRDFGMIFASARSIRSMKSKLRPHIMPGALLSLTLLKSKSRWMLLEAAAIGDKLSSKSAEYKTFLKLLLTLKTLAFGEERNESLFESMLGAYNYLLTVKDADLASLECLAMIKILHALGYGEPKNDNNYQNAEFSKDVLAKVATERPKLISSINKALQETGLQ